MSGLRHKTIVEVANRRHPHELPPWRACFVLPDRIAFAVAPGPVPDMDGCTVTMIGRSVVGEVEGRKRDWVLAQADKMASRLGHHRRPLLAWLTRDPQSDHTQSGPWERGGDGVIEIGARHQIVARTVTDGNAMRALPQ